MSVTTWGKLITHSLRSKGIVIYYDHFFSCYGEIKYLVIFLRVKIEVVALRICFLLLSQINTIILLHTLTSLYAALIPSKMLYISTFLMPQHQHLWC